MISNEFLENKIKTITQNAMKGQQIWKSFTSEINPG